MIFPQTESLRVAFLAHANQDLWHVIAGQEMLIPHFNGPLLPILGVISRDVSVNVKGVTFEDGGEVLSNE
jgi:hypothetical protein